MSRNRKHMMSPPDAYEFVSAIDLPDGAHWAMIEELSGADAADFADMDMDAPTFREPRAHKSLRCGRCGRKFGSAQAVSDHTRDKHGKHP